MMMTQETVWDTLRTVPDPEIPTLSIVDLGMVACVIVTSEQVHVTLRPTFMGCPALDWIRERTIAALHPVRAHVSYDYTHPWSSNDMTEPGRAQLKAFGIAPATAPGSVVPCPHCQSPDTRQTSPFGGTLCRSLYYCNQCKQPFDAWKPI